MGEAKYYSTEEMAQLLGFTKTYVLQLARKHRQEPEKRKHGKGNPSFYWNDKHLSVLRAKSGKESK